MIKVRVHFTLPLRRHIGCQELEIELREGATVRDLLQAIGQEWGAQLPRRMWNPQKQAFVHPVQLLGRQRQVGDGSRPLVDGEEFIVTVIAVGG